MTIVCVNINSDSVWLTENKIGKTVDISAADIEDLLLLAEQEDQWTDNVRRECFLQALFAEKG